MKRIKIRLHFLAERPQCFKSGFEKQDEGTVANNIGGGRGLVGDAPRTNVTKLMSSMTKSTPAFFDPMRSHRVTGTIKRTACWNIFMVFDGTKGFDFYRSDTNNRN